MSVAMSGMSGTEDQAKGGRIRHAILIAGPTASGKSALALTLAAETGGIIVNADSIQVYAASNVLTARPGPAELARAPHLLYGHVDPAIAYSDRRSGCAMCERLAASGAFDEPGRDFRRRHRALFPRAGPGHFGNARHAGGGARPLAGEAGGSRVPPALHEHPGGSGPACRGAAEAPATASASCAHSKFSTPRAARSSHGRRSAPDP